MSYASQDAEAAKKICEALRAAGVEVWFDQSELRGGDAWDAKIRKQIKECALFVPIISANTNARPEGYFRLEWKLAVDRSHLLADDHPFLFPIAIGDVTDATARVPDKFRDVQWTRLRLDETPAELAGRVQRLLAVGASLDDARGRAQGAPLQDRIRGNRHPHWLRYSGMVVGAIIALAYGLRPFWPSGRKQVAPPDSPPPASAPAKLSPAQDLVERANAILSGTARTREQIDTANGLLEQAMTLEPTNAAAWTAAARADLMLIYPYGYDRSEERRQRAMSRAARAVNLAPDSLDTRIVQTSVMAHASGNPALTREAEATFRQMIQERPDDHGLKLQLAEVLREENRFPEASALFGQIGEFELAAWSWYQAGDYAAAYGPVQRAVAERRTTTALQLKSTIEANWFEDLPLAQATADQSPPSELQSEIAAGNAIRIAFHRRDPERMLAILNGLPHDFLDSHAYVGPRQYLTGWAHRIAGRTERAKIEWRKALAVLETARAASPDRVELVDLEAEIHGLLGETREGEQLLAEAGRIAGDAPGKVTLENHAAYLALGRTEPVLAWLETYLRARQGFLWANVHAAARFSPIWDGLRGNPRFEMLLRETLPKGARPFDEPEAAAGLSSSAKAAEDASRGASPPDAKSIAVLAFANLSDDKENEYFSDGVSEELLNVLAKVPGLKVTARTSSFYFKGKDVPVPEIAQKLGVAYVVEGSVRKQGDRVRITAQLIKAADGFHVWSDTFTRELKDVFAVQDEIAGLVAQQLQLKLGDTATSGRPVNPEAHQLYLQGKYFVNQFSHDSLVRAIPLLQKAVELDPTFGAGWVELAHAGGVLSGYGNTREEVEGSYALARRAVERALVLQPDLAEAHVALAELQSSRDFDWKGAVASLRRARELAPENLEVLRTAQRIAYSLGRIDEAVALGEKTVALDPVNPAARVDYGYALTSAGRYAEAEAQFRRIVELNPAAPWGHAGVSFTLSAAGRFDEAATEAVLEGNEWSRLIALSLAQFGQGKKKEADDTLAELIRKFADVAAYQIAEAYAFRPEPDGAFAWLERAWRQRDPGLTWTRVDPFLRKIRADARWQPFLHQLGLADDQLP
ncbi:MAG TPA: tetratricopeptide repeat protein [Lacunisphaera sp.]|nr:tetratricopeptide repeat protein [Lacunisphaera sp.]